MKIVWFYRQPFKCNTSIRQMDRQSKPMDSRLKFRLPAVLLSGNNHRQVVHTCPCHQAVLIGTGQRAMMPHGWEGNRRSGITLAMRHRLQWFIHLRAQWLTRGRWAPRLNSSKEYGTTFLIWRLAQLHYTDKKQTSKGTRSLARTKYMCEIL